MKNRLLELLQENCRYSNEELAAMLGTTADDIAAQIREYEKTGVIRAYNALINWEKVPGSEARALIELRVAPKRDKGFQIAVISPAEGDKAASLVTEPGAWEHPSWARDRRHLVAERDGALFLIDTLENGDKPVKLFSLQGKCTMPSWQR